MGDEKYGVLNTRTGSYRFGQNFFPAGKAIQINGTLPSHAPVKKFTAKAPAEKFAEEMRKPPKSKKKI